MNVGSLNLSAGSIDVSGRSFINTGFYGSGWVAGAHLGQSGVLGVSSYTYDNPYSPTFAGSGGGSNAGGGGVIRITSDGLCTITNSGQILANGSIGSNTYGTGAGGSIYMKCGGFAGTPLAVAVQAQGAYSPNNYNGGGGGGIALISTGAASSFTGDFAYPDAQSKMPSFISTVSARGGFGSGAYSNGGAGTIYLKSADLQYGDLIVHNETAGTTGNATNGKTVLPGLSGTVYGYNGTSITATGVSPSSLSGAPAMGALYNNLFNGLYLRPLTIHADNSPYSDATPADLSDDNVVKITGSTYNSSFGTTTFSLDQAPVTETNAKFKTVYIFNHSYLSSGVTLEANGDIYIKDGNLPP
jgi:hypothetical protein